MSFVKNTAKKSSRLIVIGLFITLVTTIVTASRWESVTAFAQNVGSAIGFSQNDNAGDRAKNSSPAKSDFQNVTGNDDQLSPAATVSTNGGSGLAGTYPDLATALTALNAATITSPVVITVNGNETAPTGGYSITQLGGTAANTITIQGVGSTLTAAAAPTIGSRSDAVIRIIGGDYITIQNFTLTENPANTTGGAIAVQQMTEFGVGLFAASATNGAQNNTIQNNAIILSSATTYQNAIGIFSTSASSSTNGAQAAASIAGTNSNNKFYGNTIAGVAQGIYFISPAQTATIFESGNDIGGISAATANNITFGVSNTAGDLGFTSYSGLTAAGIYFRNVVGSAARFNTLQSTAALTLPAGGIFSASGTAPTGVTYTSTFSDNNITLTNVGITAITGIDFGSGLSTGTIAANNNTIVINQTATAANAGAVIGIKANYISASNTATGNTVTFNQSETTGALSSTATGITLAAASSSTINANSNNVTINQTGSGTGIISGALTALSVAGTSTTNNVLTNTILINQTTSVANGFTNTVSGIVATSAATTLNITTNNAITIKQAATGAGTYDTGGAITYINANATHGTANIKNNALNTTGSTIRSTGALIGIFQDSTVTVLVDIQNNTMNVDRVAVSGSAIFQSTSGTPSEVKDIVSNNNITFTNLAGTTAATAIGSLGGPSSPVVNNKSINGNTISISGTQTGTTIGISCAFTNTGFIQNNSVTVSSAASTLTGITTTGNVMTISGNTLSLSSAATAPTAMQGINGTGSGAHSITNNTFAALNFTGVTTTSPTVSGIAQSSGTAANIFANSIANISVGAAGSTGSPVINGITITGGFSFNIFKNKIYGLTTAATGASTTVNGVVLTVATNASVFNNLIGNLTAVASNNPGDSVRGISIASVTTSTAYNVYYNTVFLNASSTGTNFGTAGIFHAASTTATTATLNLRNNIIVNTSTPAGTGFTVAFRRSAGAANTLSNYAATSNNNDFYAGTPGAANLIYYDGTATGKAQTISDYKTGSFTAGVIAPRDTASFSESPNFLSVAGANANFLHINPAIATQIESGAVNISGITDDFDANIRQGNGGYGGTGTSPDVGADEFEGTAVDLNGPVISYTPFGNGAAVATRSVPGITITDISGVNTTAGTKPRLYYKKAVDANDLTGWKFVEANGVTSPFDFTISYAALNAGAVTIGDSIQYFVVAQDLAPMPNVGINSGTFAAPPTSVALTSTAFPIGGTINNYQITGSLSGALTVDSAGAINSLTNAGGVFATLNGSVLTGSVVVNVTSDLLAEMGTVQLNQLAEEPAGSGFTVTIKPSGAIRTISGASAAGLITLNGADNVIFDGTSVSFAPDQIDTKTDSATFAPQAAGDNLSIINTNTGTSSAVIWVQTTTGGNGATNNVFKNLNITGNAPTTTLIGIGFGGTGVAATSLGAGNNNNRVESCDFKKSQYAIYSQGASAANKNTGTVFTQNSINSATPNNISKAGILAGFENNIAITDNAISGITGSSGYAWGISLGLTGFATTVSAGNEVTNATILRNNIGSVRAASTFGVAGIAVAAAASGTTLIANNVISDANTNGTLGDIAAGIFIGGGAGSATQVYYNSVSMSGMFTGGTYGSFAVAIGGTNPVVDLRNNALTSTGSTGANQNRAIGLAYATFTNLTSNNNDLFVSGTSAAVGQTGTLSNTGGTVSTTLANWQTNTGKDANSTGLNPQFTSGTNLQPQLGSPLVGAGTPVGILTDILGVTRSVLTPPSGPTIGAYENAVDLTGPSIIYAALGNTTGVGNRTLSVSVTDPSGVPTSGIGLPVIYFRKGAAGAFANSQCSSVGGGNYDCLIDYSLVTGGAVAAGDTIQYYVAAQDTLGNVAVNPSTGAAGLTANPPAAATPPTTPNSYAISISYTGSYNVGTGETITSLTNPGGIFDLLNAGVLTGSVTINLTSSLTAETGTFALNQQAMECGTPPCNFTVTINPGGGAARTVSGASATALIKLNGADNVTIDGLNTGGGSLAVTNTNTSGTVIWLASLGADAGATGNAIRNTTITGGSITGATGICIGGATLCANGADNDGTILQGNTILKVAIGINVAGTAAVSAGGDDNLAIINNIVGPAAAGVNNIGALGIALSNTVAANLTGNTVRNIVAPSTAAAIAVNTGAVGGTLTQTTITNISTSSTSLVAYGIFVGTASPGWQITQNSIRNVVSSAAGGSGTVASGLYVGGTNTQVLRNTISGVINASTAGYPARGIYVNTGVTSSNITVANNMVSDIQGYSDPDVTFIYQPVGIMIEGATGGVNLYFNSVNLFGAHPGLTTATLQAALFVGASVSGLDVRNNIFANTYDNSTSTTDKSYAIYSGAATSPFATINNNDYYVSGTPGVLAFINGSDRTTLTAIQTATAQDANSIPDNPALTAPTDLHIPGTSPVESKGVSIIGITVDLDGDTRPATPDIGADEVPTPPAGTIQFNSANYPVGEAGGAVTLTVTRTGGSNGAVTVNYTLGGGSATGGASCTAGVDYINMGGSVSFVNGDAVDKTFAVTLCDDGLFETGETFDATLSIGAGLAALGTPNPATVTIADNEMQPSIQFSSAAYSTIESLTNFGVVSGATITVTRGGAPENVVSIDYATSDGTATGSAACSAGIDYRSTGGTLSFASGELSKTFFVETCPDLIYEGDETINLSLSNPIGAALGTPNVAILTIVENETQSFVQFSAASYTEDESQTVGVTVTRTGDTSGTTTVGFATSNATATGGAACTAGVDYIATSGTVTFNPGDTTQVVTVQICSDLASESTETVNLTLSNPSLPTVLGTPNTAVLSINDTASQYTNNTSIGITNGTVSNPYPSAITVTGGPSQIGSLKVTLFDVNHTLSDDLDILLVGPQGQKLILMGDAGGSNGLSTSATITFDDQAGQVLPDNGVIATGKYEPTNWITPVTSFTSPAPGGPYNEPGSAVGGAVTLNSVFAGTNPNGVWSLYVRDDAGALVPAGVGAIGGGWGIQFIAPTAASAEIGGRLLTANGAGIRNAVVKITGGNLTQPIYVRSGTFGYYQFSGLPVGQTYVISVISKKYVFADPNRVINLTESLADQNFVAEPE